MFFTTFPCVASFNPTRTVMPVADRICPFCRKKACALGARYKTIVPDPEEMFCTTTPSSSLVSERMIPAPNRMLPVAVPAWNASVRTVPLPVKNSTAISALWLLLGSNVPFWAFILACDRICCTCAALLFTRETLV